MAATAPLRRTPGPGEHRQAAVAAMGSSYMGPQAAVTRRVTPSRLPCGRGHGHAIPPALQTLQPFATMGSCVTRTACGEGMPGAAGAARFT